MILAVTFLPLLWKDIVFPYLEKDWFPKWFTRIMPVNSRERFAYTGKVKLTAKENSESVLFIGALQEGRIEGEGRLYDYEGNLIYQGGFEKEMYSGSGIEYYDNGSPKYEGGFAFYITGIRPSSMKVLLQADFLRAAEVIMMIREI